MNVMNMLKELEKLDQVAWQFEKKWGAGQLELLAPPDLREKFLRQKQKLNDAILADNHADVIVQAQGMARGWQALENAVVGAGGVPPRPEYAERTHGQKKYRIVDFTWQTYLDCVQGENIEVVSVEMLLNVYEYSHTKVIDPTVKPPIVFKEYPKGFFKNGGDDLTGF